MMKMTAALLLSFGLLLFGQTNDFRIDFVHSPSTVSNIAAITEIDVAPEELTEVVQRYCVRCHNERRLRGNLSLEDFDVLSAPQQAATAEKMIVKLQAGMMPPPGANRPSSDTLEVLQETLETLIAEESVS